MKTLRREESYLSCTLGSVNARAEPPLSPVPSAREASLSVPLVPAAAPGETLQVLTWGNNDDGQLGQGQASLAPAVTATSVAAPAADADGGSPPHALKSPRRASFGPDDEPAWPLTGSGARDTRGTPRLVHGLAPSVQIKAASCGSRHTLLLGVDGSVFSFGWGKCGQLGHGKSISIRAPMRVRALEGQQVSYVSAGGCHSACIVAQRGGTEGDGGGGSGSTTVLTWGDGSLGQLGQGIQVQASSTPRAIMGATVHPGVASVRGPDSGGIPDPIAIANAKTVSCGGQHTLALTHDGTIFAWGRGDTGQLGVGRGPFRPVMPPTSPSSPSARSPSPPRVSGQEAQASYNAWTPLRLCLDPARHSSGSAEDGVAAGESPWRAAAVACGAFHSACIGAHGDVWTWGKEDYGMLGYTSKLDQWEPHRVSRQELGGESARSIACGGWHTAVVTRSGGVLAWGRGEYGRLGLGDERSRPLPHRLEQLRQHKIVQVSAGGTHTLFLTDQGQVFSCGRAEHGRLGRGTLGANSDNLNNPTQLALVRHNTFGPVVQVSCGGAHSVALAVAESSAEPS